MSGEAAARDVQARLFVALELPDPVRRALTGWRSRLRSERTGTLRPVDAAMLHVTLCFLGWRSEDEVEAIAATCGVLAAEPAPSLALADAIWLPPRRPRVLAIELDDRDATLAQAQSALSAALVAGGWYEPEGRPFLAHVTVARVGAARGSRPPVLPEPPRLEFVGSRVVLYRSRLSRGGARYEALAGVELGP